MECIMTDICSHLDKNGRTCNHVCIRQIEIMHKAEIEEIKQPAPAPLVEELKTNAELLAKQHDRNMELETEILRLKKQTAPLVEAANQYKKAKKDFDEWYYGKVSDDEKDKILSVNVTVALKTAEKNLLLQALNAEAPKQDGLVEAVKELLKQCTPGGRVNNGVKTAECIAKLKQALKGEGG